MILALPLVESHQYDLVRPHGVDSDFPDDYRAFLANYERRVQQFKAKGLKVVYHPLDRNKLNKPAKVYLSLEHMSWFFDRTQGHVERVFVFRFSRPAGCPSEPAPPRLGTREAILVQQGIAIESSIRMIDPALLGPDGTMAASDLQDQADASSTLEQKPTTLAR